MHCDSWLLCAIQILLLTHLNLNRFGYCSFIAGIWFLQQHCRVADVAQCWRINFFKSAFNNFSTENSFWNRKAVSGQNYFTAHVRHKSSISRSSDAVWKQIRWPPMAVSISDRREYAGRAATTSSTLTSPNHLRSLDYVISERSVP